MFIMCYCKKQNTFLCLKMGALPNCRPLCVLFFKGHGAPILGEISVSHVGDGLRWMSDLSVGPLAVSDK